MLNPYSRKQRKQLDLYFRCLSSVCIDSLLGYYYMIHEFHAGERWLRKRVMKKALKFWGITDAVSLKQKIRWLLDDGYRMDYKEMHNRLVVLTEASRKRYIEASTEHPDYAKMSVVHKCLPQLPSGEIAAYGGGWAIFLSRIGLAYRYLSKEEAWEIKVEAARYLQNHYSSWADYLTGFAAGSHFSSSDHEMKHHSHIYRLTVSLLGSSSLACKKAVWEQHLLPEKEHGLSEQERLSV